MGAGQVGGADSQCRVRRRERHGGLPGEIAPADEKSRYLRIQAPLHEGNDDMDDASKTNVKVLKLPAKDLVATHSDAKGEVVERLTR